jgi:hypothetical protein
LNAFRIIIIIIIIISTLKQEQKTPKAGGAKCSVCLMAQRFHSCLATANWQLKLESKFPYQLAFLTRKTQGWGFITKLSKSVPSSPLLY